LTIFSGNFPDLRHLRPREGWAHVFQVVEEHPSKSMRQPSRRPDLRPKFLIKCGKLHFCLGACISRSAKAFIKIGVPKLRKRGTIQTLKFSKSILTQAQRFGGLQKHSLKTMRPGSMGYFC